MAGGTEGVLHRSWLTDQDPACRSHAAGDEHGLTDPGIGSGDLGMAGGKRSRRPLTMHANLRAPALADVVILELGDVMGDVVNEVHPELLPGLAENPRKDLTRLVSQELAVAPGEVGRRAHGSQVILPFRTAHRRTRELRVWQLEPILPGSVLEHLQIVVADLVAQASRPGVNQYRDLPFAQAH